MDDLLYPVRHVFITQEWGKNPDIYKRFGLKGHNGVDFRLFTEEGIRAPTAILYAPHDGTVLEASYDPNGYGNYLKIENDEEGSILAHLESFAVKVGDRVKRGQKLGLCGNTGFSTGPHLHWGYYPKPRNKTNGYSGTIDQIKYRTILKHNQTPTPEQPEEGNMSSSVIAFAGMTTDKNTIERMTEHLGERNGKCEWGDPSNGGGGYLGAERRNVEQLRIDLLREQDAHDVTRSHLEDAQKEVVKLQDDLKAMADRLAECMTQKPQEPSTPAAGLPETAKLNGITRSYTQGIFTITENYEIREA